MKGMVAFGLTIFICLHSNMTLSDRAPLQRSIEQLVFEIMEVS